MAEIIKRSLLDRPLTCEEYDSNIDAVLDRSNHTGTQSASTIYDLESTVEAYDFIEELKKCCKDLKADLGELREDIFGEGEISNLIEQLRQQIQSAIDEVLEDITDILNRVDVLENKINSFQEQLNILKTLIDGLKNELNSKANINSPTFTGSPKAPTPPRECSDTTIVNCEWVRLFAVPVGTIMMFSSDVLPDDSWRLCNGAELSRAEFAFLFSLIGGKYGVGNNSTTFNLPNIQGRFPIASGGTPWGNFGSGQYGGEAAKALSQNELPNHTHQFFSDINSRNDEKAISHYHLRSYGGSRIRALDADDNDEGRPVATYHADADDLNINIAATGGGAPFSIIPPYIVLNFIIKVK